MINISAKVKVSQYALAKKNPSAFRTPSLVTIFHCKLWATKTVGIKAICMLLSWALKTDIFVHVKSVNVTCKSLSVT